MKNYKIGLTFKNQRELDDWFEKNLKVDGRLMYKGEYVMMTCASAVAGSDEVVLDSIWTC